MKKINELLEKYYNGETSLDEESELKEFFNSNDIPADLSIHKAQFEFYESEGKKDELNSGFDEKIVNEILSRKVFRFSDYYNATWFRVAGIAAGFLLIFGLSFILYFSNPVGKDNQITLSAEDQFAYEQTIEALTKASKYINKANLELEKISIINESQEALEKVNYIEKYNKYILNLLGDES